MCAQVHRNITNAVSTALHFMVDLLVAFLFTVFVTELSKVVVGRLRCAPGLMVRMPTPMLP